MGNESRTSKAIKNIKVDLFFCLVMLFVAFFSRRIFLNNLGADFLGFVATINGLISLLHLMECGIYDSVCFALYKPLAENNHDEINGIVSFLRILYRLIGYGVLFGGCIFAFFLPMIFRKAQFPLWFVYFAYFAAVIPASLTYFVAYPAVVFAADQKRYVVSGYLQASNLICMLLQLVAACFTSNKLLYICITFCATTSYVILVKWKFSRNYPSFKVVHESFRQLSRKYETIKSKICQIFVHKFCNVAQGQLTPVLIFYFVTLKDVAYYENYMNVASKLFVVCEAVLGSTFAGVGNLLAVANDKKCEDVFQQLYSLRMTITGFVCFMLYSLLDPFIELWLGTQYLMPRWMLWYAVLYVYFAISRGAVEQFLGASGMFSDFYMSIVETMLFLVGALVLGKSHGLAGILLAKIVSQAITVAFWKPFFLFHFYFRKNIIIYWWFWFRNLAVILFSSFVVVSFWGSRISSARNGWNNWLLNAAIYALSYVFIMLPLYYTLLPGGHDLLMRIWQLVSKRKICS